MNKNFIKKLISLSLKIRWMPNAADCQILSVDNGIEYLKHCFPSSAKYFHLPVRGELIYINAKFVFLLLHYLLKKNKTGLGLRGIYVSAIAKILKPSVIITMIDNNNWDTNLSSFTGIPIIYLANGLRHPSHFPNKNFYCYFSMNTAIVDPALSFSNSFEEIHPVGHIKMGLFYENNSNHNFTSTNPGSKTLLWISQYREAIYNGSSPLAKEQKATELKGLRFMSEFADSNGYEQRIAIASMRKGTDIDTEIKQFDIATKGKISYSKNHIDDWSSYEEVKKADLVVGMFSTLLFESLSVGKRVLFFLPDQQRDLKKLVSESIRLDLLSPLVCSQCEYKEFSRKCAELLSLTDTEYINLISQFKDDVACFDKNMLPHHHIRKRITDIIGA